MNFHDRKNKRIELYKTKVSKKKLIKCSACNGSGYYDHDLNPKCLLCNGTGKVRDSA